MGERTPQPLIWVKACAKPLYRGEKCRLEHLFIFTQRWLMTFWRWPLDMENWCFEYLSHLKAIEIQHVLLKTGFIAVSLSINTLWWLLTCFCFYIKPIFCAFFLFFHLISWNSWVHSISLPGGDENVLAKSQELRPIPSRATHYNYCICMQTFWYIFIFVDWLEKPKTLSWLYKVSSQRHMFTSTPHSSYQRPPSVGMPWHALRRRAPKYIRAR